MSNQITLFIPEFRVNHLREQVEKLAKKSRKLGLPEITFSLTGKREIRDFKTTLVADGNPCKENTIKVEAVEVEIIGELLECLSDEAREFEAQYGVKLQNVEHGFGSVVTMGLDTVVYDDLLAFFIGKSLFEDEPNRATPAIEELRIQLEGAAYFVDTEYDEAHPNPIEDASDLIGEAIESLGRVEEQQSALLAALEQSVVAMLGYVHRNEVIDDALKAARAAIASAR